jgi:hypothetical protein
MVVLEKKQYQSLVTTVMTLWEKVKDQEIS